MGCDCNYFQVTLFIQYIAVIIIIPLANGKESEILLLLYIIGHFVYIHVVTS